MSCIYIIDDDENFLESLKNLLTVLDYEVVTCSNPFYAMDMLHKTMCHVVLLDVKMPGINGLDLLHKILAYNPYLPVIMLSGQSTIAQAVKAINLGAFDFIEKTIEPNLLKVKIDKAISAQKFVVEKAQLTAHLQDKYKIVTQSPVMISILKLVEKIAPSSAKVLITGETGTGKELIARAIHFRSERSSGPFIKINCAAIPSELLESELFGHKKGAFTGAVAEYAGKFQAANSGTLFLDEIGDMSLMLQAKLLHVLQDNQFMMLGSNKSIKIDARIIAATNQDLTELIKQKRFREDLYHRLNVVNIHIPPLRERKEDIEPLSKHFLREFAESYNKRVTSISPNAMSLLKMYDWPGNIRELKNVVEKLVLYSTTQQVSANVVKQILFEGERDALNETAPGKTLKEKMSHYERSVILEALKKSGGKIGEAAKLLGIDRSALFKKKRKFGID